jgi:PPOX class probable F420-dependent enzyme
VDLSAALAFAHDRGKAVFVTQRKDGRPHLSNVLVWIPGDGTARVSITTDRVKYRNLQREPWAAIHVASENFWTWAVIEGPVELSEIAAAPADDTVDELVEYYRALSGEHSDWDDYRAAMVREHRLVARIRPTHAYGVLPG